MLSVTDLRAGYGAINILWDVSLRFPLGQLTAIIGPNGAGKTTLLRAIMGLIPVTLGDVTLDSYSLRGRNTWDMAGMGLALIPEGRMVFADMSVEDNLAMGAFPKPHRPALARNLERVFGLFPRLHERRRQLAGSLSGGEAQMLALGRGLMSEPRLLLIDEPSLGLAPVIVHEIFAILRGLKEQGVTIVLVEQNTHMALAVADSVYLMRSGRVLLNERAAAVDSQRLHDLYFAREG
ncbi:MAG: ABC transporter ATP-binding protein [Proteobacteria bacterium]|nr:ABC transporter ATP-binding protein [Pseudomonadota bacterium]